MSSNLKKIIIVGGGTAGWMAAAAFGKFLSPHQIDICLVESSEIGTVGVGEATLPGIRDFNIALGIDEIDFIKKTQATFKLGIKFNDWKKIGSSFFHPFANYGLPVQKMDFYQVWQHLYKMGDADPLENYCLSTTLAYANKFAQPNLKNNSPLADYYYAYHFDAALYAAYLKDYALKNGVIAIDGKIQNVIQDGEGCISKIQLENGAELSGDFFIDCSGLKGLLIEKTLDTGFEDWSKWLPMNSAIAIQSAMGGELSPYTSTTAREAGWQWRIPLQHRVGNGYVYCDKFISNEKAAQFLLDNIEGESLTDPKLIKFTTGKRKKFWNKNCVALGLASGFLEPLESTSISLIQTGISRLLQFFPFNGLNNDDIKIANKMAEVELERIRDFIILHYILSERNDSQFWREVKNIEVPESLLLKILAFKRRGVVVNLDSESFSSSSWISLYNGFGIIPDEVDLKAMMINKDLAKIQLSEITGLLHQAEKTAPKHNDILNKIITI